jgi:hypothetical protein
MDTVILTDENKDQFTVSGEYSIDAASGRTYRLRLIQRPKAYMDSFDYWRWTTLIFGAIACY